MGVGINARADSSHMQARNRGELEGRGKQSKMVCKENKADWERETEDKKKWEGREGGWIEGKTGAERWRDTEGGWGREILWPPTASSSPASVSRGLNFLYFYKMLPYPFSDQPSL